MTICPKCGKEYRITPDVCSECGTPLAAPEIADPFAEAVKEETELREKARRRLAEQTEQASAAQFSEESDNSDVITRAAEEVKPARRKLRAAAVTAAFAVAAGGGWLGWRHFRGAQSPAGMDIRFFDGNQPCFYDGSTGTVHQIGNPIDPEATDLGSDWKETFWQEFQISADRSCVFYPEYLASGSSYVSNGFIPCRLELKEQNGSKGKNGRLTDDMEEFAGTDGTVAYYEVMDNFGDKVLMIRYMEDPETSGRLDTQYVVWQNEERYGTGGGILEGSDSPVLDGLSLPMTDNQDGSYLSLSSQVLPFGTEADQPVLAIPGVFNAGECFRIDLMRKDGTLEKNICTAGINLQIETPWDFEGPREGNSARYFKPRYLFYEALEETDHFERPERDFTLVGDGYELLVREDESIVQLHIREGTDSLTQEELAQKAQELMNRSRFAVVSGVHRLDRVTGEDVLILTGNSEWTVWKTLGTGSLLKIEALDPDMNEYAYHLCSIENGEMTEKTLLTTEDETEKYTFVAGICGRDDMYYYANEESRSYLAVNGQIHELLIAASEKDDVIYDDPDHRVHSLILSDCSLSKSGDRALLRLEGRYYLCDLSGLGPDSRITAEEVKDAEKAFFSGDYSITVKSRTGNYGKLVLAADDTVITSMGMSFFDDQANGAVYFTEEYDGRISLCRWQDGKTVRIADGITYITSDSPTLLFDNLTGGFAFVMTEERDSGKQYTIYTGNIESSSVEDCRAVWSGKESPVLCNAYRSRFIT